MSLYISASDQDDTDAKSRLSDESLLIVLSELGVLSEEIELSLLKLLLIVDIDDSEDSEDELLEELSLIAKSSFLGNFKGSLAFSVSSS